MNNNIISLSGGKDSTAMLLMMIERGEMIHSVVFFDTGWEFPQMYEHIDLLERRTGIRIWRLRPTLPFDYWLTSRPVLGRSGNRRGKLQHIGKGWPQHNERWCTGKKQAALDMFCNPIENVVQCVGYAADEPHRVSPKNRFFNRFPLREWGITEADALKFCYSKGYTWGGLYEIFDNVSCYCCPLQSYKNMKSLRKFFPELWQKMLKLESEIPEPLYSRGFQCGKTLKMFDDRFAENDRQLCLFGAA